MDQETVIKIYKETISHYNKIASSFAQTRSFIWPDLKGLESYYERGKKVLDLGCGNGRLIKLLNAIPEDYLGVDASKQLIQIAQKKFPNHEFKVADYLELDFKNHFDLIYWIAGLHHLPSHKLRLKILEKIKNFLADEGILIVTCWNLWQKKYWPYLLKNFFLKLIGQSKLDFFDAFIPWKAGPEKINRYYHAFREKELKKLFQKAGFDIIKFKKTAQNYLVVAKKRAAF